MQIAREFRDFAMRGNVVDMAVGIVIGAAFGTIVRSFVDHILMPPIGVLTGGVDFADLRLRIKEGVPATGEQAAIEPVFIAYGQFLNATISFLIVAFVLFLVIRAMNSARRRFDREVVESPTPPPATPENVLLLREIRDLLRRD